MPSPGFQSCPQGPSLPRVVSLVPSWTETLVRAGVNVVGRTRYCIHPGDCVAPIPIVGGTKDLDAEQIRAARPDLVILDREENTREVAAQIAPLEVPMLVTHVRTLRDARDETERLAQATAAPLLAEQVHRWQAILEAGPLPELPDLAALPGAVTWWRRPSGPVLKTVYLIWENPWMTIGAGTFIGATLRWVGCRTLHVESEKPYAELVLSKFDPRTTCLLFSSEPYPFALHATRMQALGFPCAWADGEKFSWYGLRALEFLEECRRCRGYA